MLQRDIVNSLTGGAALHQSAPCSSDISLNLAPKWYLAVMVANCAHRRAGVTSVQCISAQRECQRPFRRCILAPANINSDTPVLYVVGRV